MKKEVCVRIREKYKCWSFNFIELYKKFNIKVSVKAVKASRWRSEYLLYIVGAEENIKMYYRALMMYGAKFKYERNLPTTFDIGEDNSRNDYSIFKDLEYDSENDEED